MGSPYAKLSQNRYKHKCKTKYKIWGKKNLCDFGCDNDFFFKYNQKHEPWNKKLSWTVLKLKMIALWKMML